MNIATFSAGCFWGVEASFLEVDNLENRGAYKTPIVTEVVPAITFWSAEKFHQRYFEKNGIKVCQN